VVELTLSGAVPVATVEISCPVLLTLPETLVFSATFTEPTKLPAEPPAVLMANKAVPLGLLVWA
jgi:hypothetical protein